MQLPIQRAHFILDWGLKRLVREAIHSRPSGFKVRNERVYNSPVPYAFMSCTRTIRFACSSKPCRVGSTEHGRAYLVTEHFWCRALQSTSSVVWLSVGLKHPTVCSLFQKYEVIPFRMKKLKFISTCEKWWRSGECWRYSEYWNNSVPLDTLRPLVHTCARECLRWVV
jgi:hypothetical protein